MRFYLTGECLPVLLHAPHDDLRVETIIMKFANICRSMTAAIALSVAVSGGAQAQNSEAVDVARELVEVVRPVNDQMLADMITRVQAGFESALGDADAATRQEIKADIERIMRKYDGKLQAELPSIYARHFDAAELRELKDFYATPLGRKALTSMPAIMNEAMAETMGPMQQDIVTSMQAIMQRRAAK
jgi:uncharacterized protein